MNEVVSDSPVLVWETDPDDAYPGATIHFQVQVATDEQFLSLSRYDFSYRAPERFEYESSPGVWDDFPIGGLPEADMGKSVRYTPSLVEEQPYYWRVSTEQFF